MSIRTDGSSVDLMSIAHLFSRSIVVGSIIFTVLGLIFNPWFFIGTGVFGLFLLLEIHYRFVQKGHAILRNFGVFGAMRYLMESVGPELRQYWMASDTEEKPFSRRARAEVYRYAKNRESTASYGTLEELRYGMIQNSLYPLHNDQLQQYSLTFGQERGIENSYTITKPSMISAMSFGALGEHAVRALARGAKRAGIPINTGEGGFPKYHLMEGPDIIFQIGTAKFGVRNDDGSLNKEKLREIVAHDCIKMVELKLSQGAKPGKGGLLPGDKVTPEIAKLRGVPVGEDVLSPPCHVECKDAESTVRFFSNVQDVSQLPVGIKLCLGNIEQFDEFIQEMKRQDRFPDYIVIDGAEGGTGAAPRSFMDYVGIPLFRALDYVKKILKDKGVRHRFKLVASGKLVNPARQINAFSYGVDAVYTARGFMLALGCIQALRCNQGVCPVGITTHDRSLQRGLVIEDKAQRVENYVKNMNHELEELLAATGFPSLFDLRDNNVIFKPWEHN